MSYSIVIILIATLIVAGIAATAVQQHNERKEKAKREEITKFKNVLDDTETAISVAQQMPVSGKLILILRTRSLKALKGIYEQAPAPETKQRMLEIANAIKGADPDKEVPDLNSFALPNNDKAIIKYIQAIKKLRIMLKSEASKGNISQKMFQSEDKLLEKLQLRVNIETLQKRAQESINASMQGSARQYFEKAIKALQVHKPQDEYTQSKLKSLSASLESIEANLKENNMQMAMAKKQQESQGIDDLFAPKKKW